jgi:Flp pilus assembly protein TadD
MSDITRTAEADAAASAAASARVPAELELMDLLGYIYLQHGRPDKAAVLLAARDVLAPDDTRTLLSLALAQVRSAKPARAIDTLDRLALLGAMDAPFHLVRAQALQALGRAEEAAGAMRAYVSMRPVPVPVASTASASAAGARS